MGTTRHTYVLLGLRLPVSELLGEPLKQQGCSCEFEFDVTQFQFCPNCKAEMRVYMNSIGGVDIDNRTAWGYDIVDAGMLEDDDHVVISYKVLGEEDSHYVVNSNKKYHNIYPVELPDDKAVSSAYSFMSEHIPTEIWQKYCKTGFGVHLLQSTSW